MLRLLSSKAQGRKDFGKSSKPCLVGSHLKALDECYQMSTHLPGFQKFSGFLHHFVLAKLATSSISVKCFSIICFPRNPLVSELSPKKQGCPCQAMNPGVQTAGPGAQQCSGKHATLGFKTIH